MSGTSSVSMSSDSNSGRASNSNDMQIDRTPVVDLTPISHLTVTQVSSLNPTYDFQGHELPWGTKMVTDANGSNFDTAKLATHGIDWLYNGRLLVLDEQGTSVIGFADLIYPQAGVFDDNSSDSDSIHNSPSEHSPSNPGRFPIQDKSLVNRPSSISKRRPYRNVRLENIALDGDPESLMIPAAAFVNHDHDPEEVYNNVAQFVSITKPLSGPADRYFGFEPEDVLNGNALHCQPCRPSNLSRPTLKIFEYANFLDTPRDVYEVIVPALALAENLILQGNPQFFATLAAGTRIVDEGLTGDSDFVKHRVYPVQTVTTEIEISLLERLQEIGSHMQWQFRGRPGVFGSLVCPGPFPRRVAQGWDTEHPLDRMNNIFLSKAFFEIAKYYVKLAYPDEAQKLRFLFFLAVVICHELSHCLDAHCADLWWVGYCAAKREKHGMAIRLPQRIHEALVGNDTTSEMGGYFEWSTFNARISPMGVHHVHVKHGVVAHNGSYDIDHHHTWWPRIVHRRTNAMTIPMGYIEEIQQRSFWSRKDPNRSLHIPIGLGGLASMAGVQTSTVGWRRFLLERERLPHLADTGQAVPRSFGIPWADHEILRIHPQPQSTLPAPGVPTGVATSNSVLQNGNDNRHADTDRTNRKRRRDSTPPPIQYMGLGSQSVAGTSIQTPPAIKSSGIEGHDVETSMTQTSVPQNTVNPYKRVRLDAGPSTAQNHTDLQQPSTIARGERMHGIIGQPLDPTKIGEKRPRRDSTPSVSPTESQTPIIRRARTTRRLVPPSKRTRLQTTVRDYNVTASPNERFRYAERIRFGTRPQPNTQVAGRHSNTVFRDLPLYVPPEPDQRNIHEFFRYANEPTSASTEDSDQDHEFSGQHYDALAIPADRLRLSDKWMLCEEYAYISFGISTAHFLLARHQGVLAKFIPSCYLPQTPGSWSEYECQILRMYRFLHPDRAWPVRRDARFEERRRSKRTAMLLNDMEELATLTGHSRIRFWQDAGRGRPFPLGMTVENFDERFRGRLEALRASNRVFEKLTPFQEVIQQQGGLHTRRTSSSSRGADRHHNNNDDDNNVGFEHDTNVIMNWLDGLPTVAPDQTLITKYTVPMRLI